MSTPTLEQAREAIRAVTGESEEMILIAPSGGPEDELALVGAQTLLEGQEYRCVDLAEPARVRGGVAVVVVGCRLNRPVDPVLARSLAVAGARCDRVIVLPGALDPADDLVHGALLRTAPFVFAGDPVTRTRVQSICDVRLLPDCAFFFDYAPHRRPGAGVLNAFREDGMRRLDVPLPADNEDISQTHPDLASWLALIAGHELVRTDRLYVMIAAAMLGKRVEYGPYADEHIASTARSWLGALPVTAAAQPQPSAAVMRHRADWYRHETEAVVRGLPAPMGAPAAAPAGPGAGGQLRSRTPRVTVVMLNRDRPLLALRALSVLEKTTIPLRIVVIDNNSMPAAAEALAAACRDDKRILFERSPRNLGGAGGRRRGTDLSETELVLFLDDDAELLPGALEHLVAELDAHPEADVVVPTVVSSKGWIQHSGGEMHATPDCVHFWLTGQWAHLQDGSLPPSGPTGWAPATVLLVRRTLLEACPWEGEIGAYFEDNEWSWRVFLRRPGCFRRSVEAVAIHRNATRQMFEDRLDIRTLACEWLGSLAYFMDRYGRLISPWSTGLFAGFSYPDGSWNLAGTKLVLSLVLSKGTDWVFAAWTNGQLRGLVDAHGSF